MTRQQVTLQERLEKLIPRVGDGDGGQKVGDRWRREQQIGGRDSLDEIMETERAR